jgi:glutamate synthase (NADPH/NADH) small chain
MDQKSWRELENRCIQEEAPPCTARCPIHVDVRTFLRKAAAGDWDRAAQVLAAAMPFPGILGRICDHPCEQVCRRGEAGGAISIGELERAVVKRGDITRRRAPLPQKEQRVAVVGSGLSGLTAALDLRLKGYGVTLFEPGDQLGSALWHLLPGQIIEAETAVLETLGVTVRLHELIDGGSRLKVFDAVYLGLDSGAEPPLVPPASGLFIGGEPFRGYSPISAVAEGRRAAVSIDRYLQKVSAAAGREREGPYESRLYTSLESIPPRTALPMEHPESGYSDEEARTEAGRCIQCECMECVKNCLFLERFKAYPKQYVRQISNDATVVLGAHGATRRLVNSCSLCGLCAATCPNDLSMAQVCMEGRRSLVGRGKMPASAHEFALEDMASAMGQRAAMACHEPGKEVSRFVFFPGCQLSGVYPEHVFSVYALLRGNLGGGTGLMLRCCGVPAKWAARDGLFEEAIRAVEHDWNSLGRPVLIVACPTCYRIFKERLPQVELVSLWHTLAGISEQSGPRQSPLARRLAVHDPCTARHETGMQDAVRSLLARRGCTLEELSLSRTETECCGYGGLMSTANPPLARDVAARRARLSETDYVTYCAMCRNALAVEGKRVLHVLDVLFSTPETDAAARRPCGWSERRENRYRLKERLVGSLWGGSRRTMEAYESVLLDIPDEVMERMEERRILREDVQKVIYHAKTGRDRFVNPESGRSLASFTLGHVTYWVEYSDEGSAFRIHNAYSHRMEIGDSSGLKVWGSE